MDAVLSEAAKHNKCYITMASVASCHNNMVSFYVCFEQSGKSQIGKSQVGDIHVKPIHLSELKIKSHSKN